MYKPKNGDMIELDIPGHEYNGYYVVDDVKRHPQANPINGYFMIYLKDYTKKGRSEPVASRWVHPVPENLSDV